VTVTVGGASVDGVVFGGAVVGAVVGVVLTEVLVGVVGALLASAALTRGLLKQNQNASSISSPATM